MKTCHICGLQVDDRVLICPDCGATVVGDTGGLTLKPQEEPRKRAGNPMGMTVPTGSGLTDILRGEDGDEDAYDEVYTNGSMPVSLSMNVIEDDGSVLAYRKERKQLKSNLFKLLVVVALAVFGYILVTTYLDREKGAETPEKLLDIYVDAVNNQSVDKLNLIVPYYFTDRSDRSKAMLDSLKESTISSYNILEKTELTVQERNELQDSIKYQTTKTANITGGYKIKVTFVGTSMNGGNRVNSTATVEMVLIQLKKGVNEFYYIHIDTYDNPDFNYR